MFIFDNFQYDLSLSDKNLTIKAFDLKSLSNYTSVISEDSLADNKLFDSLENLHQMLTDALNETNKEDLEMVITNDEDKKTINIKLEIVNKYFNESINLQLVKVDEEKIVKNKKENTILQNKLEYMSNKIFELETMLGTALDRIKSLEDTDVMIDVVNSNLKITQILTRQITQVAISSYSDKNDLYRFEINKNGQWFLLSMVYPIDFLKKFKNLNYLKIKGGKIENLKFLKGCNNLKTLELENTSDLRAISTLPRLPSLTLLEMINLPLIPVAKTLKKCKTLEKVVVHRCDPKIMKEINDYNYDFEVECV